MRILQVGIGFLSPSGVTGPVTVGGTARVMYNNGIELYRRGHAVEVYCTNRLDKRRRLSRQTIIWDYDGIKVTYFNTYALPWWPGTMGPTISPDAFGVVRRELHLFDVVHLHEIRSFLALIVALFAQRYGIPYVVQPHGSLMLYYNSRLAKRIYDGLFLLPILHGARRVIALHEIEKQECVQVGVPYSKIEVIPNGIPLAFGDDIPSYGTFRRRFGIEVQEKLILFVGRLEKRKGIDLLIRAFSLLDRKDARLVIVGPDDGFLQRLRQLVKMLSIEPGKVIFTGGIHHSEVYQAYKDADVFVHPCPLGAGDAFPMSILEAAACGVPLVLSGSTKSSHLFQDGAIIVPPDPSCLADAINRILDDDLLKIEKGRRARRIAEGLSITGVVSKLEALYKQVTK